MKTGDAQPGGPDEMQRVERLVEELVRQVFGLAPEEASPNARFGEDIGIDSYELLELAMAAQTRFGVRIGDEALAEVETVSDLTRCVIEEMHRRRHGRRSRRTRTD